MEKSTRRDILVGISSGAFVFGLGEIVSFLRREKHELLVSHSVELGGPGLMVSTDITVTNTGNTTESVLRGSIEFRGEPDLHSVDLGIRADPPSIARGAIIASPRVTGSGLLLYEIDIDRLNEGDAITFYFASVENVPSSVTVSIGNAHVNATRVLPIEVDPQD